MKTKLIVWMISASAVVGCNAVPANETEELNSKARIGCEDDAWLGTLIESLESRDQKAEIIQYRYNNQFVYYVDDCKGCADAMQIVYGCTGEVRCTFGGIAGFNTCPDFFEKATDKKIVWQN